MSKIVVLGDIHGRDVWKDIIAKEDPEQVIFLGDYLSSHDNIPSEIQVDNFKEIIDYKLNHPNTILLRGNHDLQHLDYPWAKCSGYFPVVERLMKEWKQVYLDNTQWLYIIGDTVFSHAGISRVWLREEMHIDPDNLTDEILLSINELEPSRKFWFIDRDSWDIYGESPHQSLTWIRPSALEGVMIPGYNQVVGHTTINKVVSMKGETGNDLWLCDALGDGWYLTINNGAYEAKQFNDKNI